MSCSVLFSCRCCRCCCCCNVPRTSRPQSNFVFAFVGLRSYRKRGPKRSPQFTVIAVVRANSCDININQVWKRVSGNTCFQNNVSANRCLICNNWKVPFTRRLQSNFVFGWSYCCWVTLRCSYRKHRPKRSPYLTYSRLCQQLRYQPSLKTGFGQLCFQNNISANMCLICNNSSTNFSQPLLLDNPTLKDERFCETVGVWVWNKSIWRQRCRQQLWLEWSLKQAKWPIAEPTAKSWCGPSMKEVLWPTANFANSFATNCFRKRCLLHNMAFAYTKIFLRKPAIACSKKMMCTKRPWFFVVWVPFAQW